MVITQKQIAERLKISRATVAHALNGHSDVSEDSRQRVLAAATQMGYDRRSNSAARTLIASRYGKPVKKHAVAITYFAPDKPFIHEIPFFTPILEGIEAEAKTYGMEICLCPLRDETPHRLVRDYGVDGIIALTHSPSLTAGLEGIDLPVVLLQHYAKEANTLSPDDREGGRIATRYLIELGHTQIVYLGVASNTEENELRMQGYLDAMKEHGLPVRDEWLKNRYGAPLSTGSGSDACVACPGLPTLIAENGGMDEEGRPPFTGVICYNDAVAMDSVDCARRMGIEVPRDLSVVGFDNLALEYDFRPALTSIDFDRKKTGRELMSFLHELITDRHNGVPHESERRVVPVRLVEWESTAKPAFACKEGFEGGIARKGHDL